MWDIQFVCFKNTHSTCSREMLWPVNKLPALFSLPTPTSCLVSAVRWRFCFCWFIVCGWYHFVRIFRFVLGLWFSSTLCLSGFASILQRTDACYLIGPRSEERCHLQTTKVQTRLRKCAVWSECPCCSLFGKKHILTYNQRNVNFLTSLCSWAGWFESLFVGNLEDRFCRNDAQQYSWFMLLCQC